MKKYLSEFTDVNKIDHELFNDFMKSVGISNEDMLKIAESEGKTICVSNTPTMHSGEVFRRINKKPEGENL